MTDEQASQFASEWIAAWNSKDLDRVLAHYAKNVIFRSPNAQRVIGTGTVTGKDALAAYWRAALPLAPDLHFTLVMVLKGHEALTILYDNERGRRVAETFVFGPDGLITESLACYA